MSDTPPPPPPSPEEDHGSSIPPPPPDPSSHAPQATTGWTPPTTPTPTTRRDAADHPNTPSGSPAKQGNGLGIAGFVVALVGGVLFWVPVLGIILAAIGVVFSVIGLRAATKSGAPHKGLSIAGLVVGIAALLVSIVITIAVFVIVDDVVDCLDHYDDYLRAPVGSEAEAEAYDRWIECSDGN